MSHANEEGRPEPPLAGDEISTFLGSLERQRATFAWKCGGLDAAGMRATVGASSITIAGLLKHLALVEDHTFSTKYLGRSPGKPWEDVNWDADPDWEWHSASADTPEQLLSLWRDAVARSRATVDSALARDGLDGLSPSDEWDTPPNLRRLMIDLIEEYARHVGHADLIRESVDGLTGEDPPDGVLA
jgi:hypothetical protein